MRATRSYVNDHRARARQKGGVIVYAIITDPQAVKAWEEIKKIHGSNRDAIEAAIIDYHEQLESP